MVTLLPVWGGLAGSVVKAVNPHGPEKVPNSGIVGDRYSTV